ncbi:MAG: pyrroline-5-carboxylate reductase [Chthoniobacterales bacterium]
MVTQTWLGFIGAGKLAGSVIRGLLRAKFCEPGAIIASEPNEQLRAALREATGIVVTAENAEVVGKAEVILLGVKPGVVVPMIREITDRLTGKLAVSLAAGIRLADMEKHADARFMRVLTNTPSAIRQGASALARGTRTTDADVARVEEIFRAVGSVVEVEEEQIDAVTALSGSGPAFVYSVIEALATGGEKEGLPANVALTLASQTVLGAAQLALESGLSPDELRHQVITPGGTTAAGLAQMEKHETAAGLIAAVKAAAARGREMARS